MTEEKNISLEKMNSFGVIHRAKKLISFENKDEVIRYLKNNKSEIDDILILGEGSNTLFTKDYNGIIFQSNIKGIDIINEDNESITLKVGSGENWDDFVDFCVNSEYYGIENLSLIPGSVGAAPIQNIGAYGVEINEYVVRVSGVDLSSNTLVEFSNKDCEFSYRDSVFKKKLRNKFFITSVEFKLYKKLPFNLSYSDLEKLNTSELTISKLREEIIKIRTRKLPDPKSKGNAGSFFKNPEIDENKLKNLISRHKDFKYFKIKDKKYKVPAAWLIEKSGWKGYNDGFVGVFEHHALVLVNHKSEDGNDIHILSKSIKDDVRKKFDIILEEEVNII